MITIRPEAPGDPPAITALLETCFPTSAESRLVRAGLEAARRRGHRWAVLLGDPACYGRFGFQTAPAFSLADADGGGEAFQVIAQQPGGIPVGA